MSKFLAPLRMELITDADGVPLRTRGGRPLYRLLDAFVCVSEAVAAYRKDDGTVRAEAGFVTDLASFPQIALAFFGNTAEGPSVPHDKLYSTGTVPRHVADAMLYELCVASGISRFRSALIWLGARIGGRSHYAAAI